MIWLSGSVIALRLRLGLAEPAGAAQARARAQLAPALRRPNALWLPDRRQALLPALNSSAEIRVFFGVHHPRFVQRLDLRLQASRLFAHPLIAHRLALVAFARTFVPRDHATGSSRDPPDVGAALPRASEDIPIGAERSSAVGEAVGQWRPHRAVPPVIHRESRNWRIGSYFPLRKDPHPIQYQLRRADLSAAHVRSRRRRRRRGAISSFQVTRSSSASLFRCE